MIAVLSYMDLPFLQDCRDLIACHLFEGQQKSRAFS